MNRKLVFLAVALMAVAMLALPMSVVSATKPEEIVFYGYPMGSLSYSTWESPGESDNLIGVWTDLPWGFSTSYIIPGTTPPPFIPTGVFATGAYDGRWVLHGFDPGPSRTSTSVNANGIYTVAVTKWAGAPATGNLVILGAMGNEWVILSGEINGQKVHGQGTTTAEIGIVLFKFEGTVHFDP